MFFSQLLILTDCFHISRFGPFSSNKGNTQFTEVQYMWHIIRQPELLLFNVMTIWCFQGFKCSRPLHHQRPQVFFHSWGIKTQKIKNILWFVCNFTFSSPLPTTCVVASVRDTSLRCPLWSTVAVLPGVTMATPPLHFCHHLVGYFISRSPVRPIAEDEKRVCETTSRFSCVFTRHDPVTLSSRLFLVCVGRGSKNCFIFYGQI